MPHMWWGCKSCGIWRLSDSWACGGIVPNTLVARVIPESSNPCCLFPHPRSFEAWVFAPNIEAPDTDVGTAGVVGMKLLPSATKQR